MNRRQLVMLSAAACTLHPGSGQTERRQLPAHTGDQEGLLEKLLLKDYRPRPIFKIPKTEIARAKYPIIDVHCHGPRPAGKLDEWVKLMDAVGVERTVIFTGADSRADFAKVRRIYAKYRDRFELWCGFNLAGVDQPGFGPNAVKSLEECHSLGAVGVGEISDKGFGFGSRVHPAGSGAASTKGRTVTPGPHPDDARMDNLWDKCAQLGMPVNIHVSDPIWAYEPMNGFNDGLPNAYRWRIDDQQPGILTHNALIESLERTLQKHSRTVFIACHLANLSYDLTRMGDLFDRHPNLYGDISARFGDLAPIPRFTRQFMQRYQDRVVYGTDMAYSQRMFSSTFRILESLDEHFYEFDLDVCYDYHWPLHGLGLSDSVLKKVYRDNALEVFKRARG